MYIGCMRYPSVGNNERTGCGAASISLNLLQYSEGTIAQESEELTTTYISFLVCSFLPFIMVVASNIQASKHVERKTSICNQFECRF